jgi:glycyl-tRNA synthetase
MCEYDESGSVGKRYRRQDEIGTPYCVTIDFESVEEKNEDGTDNKNFNTVTVRDRDSMDQVRIKLEDINEYFVSKFN